MFKKRIIILMFIIRFLILFKSIALAQSDTMPKKSENLESPKVKEFIEVLWVWKLTKALDLNEEKLTLLIPKLKRLEDVRRESVKKRRNLLFRLRKAVKNNEDDATIKSLLDKLDQLFKDLIKQRETIEQEIRSVLTTREWAQFVLLKEDFEKDLRTFLLISKNKNIKEKFPYLKNKR